MKMFEIDYKTKLSPNFPGLSLNYFQGWHFCLFSKTVVLDCGVFDQVLF